MAFVGSINTDPQLHATPGRERCSAAIFNTCVRLPSYLQPGTASYAWRVHLPLAWTSDFGQLGEGEDWRL